jgi:hypothetical protein
VQARGKGSATWASGHLALLFFAKGPQKLSWFLLDEENKKIWSGLIFFD